MVDIKKEIGHRLKSAREAAGLTQEDLAARLGVTQTAISYWESGARSPGIPRMLEIALVLNVPLGDLLPPKDPHHA